MIFLKYAYAIITFDGSLRSKHIVVYLDPTIVVYSDPPFGRYFLSPVLIYVHLVPITYLRKRNKFEMTLFEMLIILLLSKI